MWASAMRASVARALASSKASTMHSLGRTRARLEPGLRETVRRGLRGPVGEMGGRGCAQRASRELRATFSTSGASTTASTSPLGGATRAVSDVPQPTKRQLWVHALRCGIPMVGFGIIDNLVMISAGEHIQSSIGITLGLTTMAAAGLGQVVSDISGIMSGGTVDAVVGKLLPNLPRSGLTSLQKDLSSSRIAQTAGGCVGVTIGCLLGMSVLLFVDAEAVERQRTAAELERIFDVVEKSAMDAVDRTLGAEMSILWLVDTEKDNTIWTRVVADGDVPTDLEVKKTDFVSAIKRTGSSRDLVNKTITTGSVQHAALDGGGPIKNMMTVPIVGSDGEILGAIQIVNRKDSGGGEKGFTGQDAKVLKVLCAHISSFLEIMQDYQ
ncbi:DUF2453 domain-containing transmembrane protein [Chloropicon primus]|nr:DUF2453 domain-containing transmembrane protein [Chloropicon primus]